MEETTTVKKPKAVKDPAVPKVVRAVKKVVEEVKTEKFLTVGRRKSAIAQVVMIPGTGAITINGKEYKQYFPTFTLQQAVEAPLAIVSALTTFDITVSVNGGGMRGQSEAVRHGITRGLILWNVDLKKTLRSEGYVTRDPRVKERKKPGLKRARRAPQFSKR